MCLDLAVLLVMALVARMARATMLRPMAASLAKSARAVAMLARAVAKAVAMTSPRGAGAPTHLVAA